MSHELFRLTESLCGKQLLVTEDYLQRVMSILDDRNLGKFLSPVTDKLSPRKREVSYDSNRKLGVIPIQGGITDVPYQAMCEEESVSHQSIREEFKQLVDSGAQTIVLDQDSNGGFAHMSFESANYIRNLADENNVKIISYNSGASHSASYVYTAVAHEAIINPSAETGSIGVRALLRNTNGYFKSMGIEDIHVTAGEGKVPFDEDGKFTKEYISEVQEGVLETYKEFTSHVAMWRGMKEEDVIKLGARTYNSKKALQNGLVDKIMTLEEFKNYLDEINSGETMASPVQNQLTNKDKEKMSDVDVNKIAELEASLKGLMADFEDAKQSLSAKDEALTKALAQLAAVDAEKKALKESTRKEKLTAAVGSAKAEQLSVSLSSLEDEAFESVLSVLSVSADKYDDVEQGASTADDTTDEVDYNEKALNNYLKNFNKGEA